MATVTLGTNANNTLTAIAFNQATAIADIATIQQHILDDRANVFGSAYSAPAAKPVYPAAFSPNGLLYVPNRGVLRVLPGDYVAYDANGWPILVSANAIAGGAAPSAVTDWTHT